MLHGNCVKVTPQGGTPLKRRALNARSVLSPTASAVPPTLAQRAMEGKGGAWGVEVSCGHDVAGPGAPAAARIRVRRESTELTLDGRVPNMYCEAHGTPSATEWSRRCVPDARRNISAVERQSRLRSKRVAVLGREPYSATVVPPPCIPFLFHSRQSGGVPMERRVGAPPGLFSRRRDNPVETGSTRPLLPARR